MGGRTLVWKLALAIVVVAGLAAAFVFVVHTDAGLEYDDAVYLARGFYHAAQVAERGFPAPLRLAWSLRFESPKPPLFQGWLALLALAFPWDRLREILVLGAIGPLAALVTGMAWLSGRLGGARAATLSLAIYAMSPLALLIGTRLLVETTLAATIVFAALAALRRCEGESLLAELAFGALGGLALLTKLLAPVFLGPLALVLALEVGRREGRGESDDGARPAEDRAEMSARVLAEDAPTTG